jgi:imidazolonepropionase
MLACDVLLQVRHTTAATEDELERLLLQRLDRMLACGTTTCEAKSGALNLLCSLEQSRFCAGYGLALEPEMKLLRVMHRRNVRAHAVELAPTFLGAHSVPAGSTAAQATADIVDRQIPALVALRDSDALRCENIDAFVERNVFERADAARLLAAGAAAGLRVNFHGDELTNQVRRGARPSCRFILVTEIGRVS